MGTQVPRGLLPELMRVLSLLSLLLLCCALQAQMGRPMANDIGGATIQPKQLKSVFLGNRSIWPSGKAVTVVLPSSDSENFESVAQWALGSNGIAYQKHWLSIVFQGRAFAPVFLADEAAIIEYVKAHPGSIGLLYSSPPPPELTIRISE